MARSDKPTAYQEALEKELERTKHGRAALPTPSQKPVEEPLERSKRTRSDKQKDYYERFADKLIVRIRKGTAPWQRPWQPGESALPENMASSRKYTGGNTLYLAMAAEDRGFSDNRWGTYRQIQALGGQVRKGETGEHVVFFARDRRIAQRDAAGKVRKGADGKTLYRRQPLDKPVWRTFVVFNAEQAHGLKLPKRADQEPAWLPQKRAEAVIVRSGVDIRHQHGDRAFYHLPRDQVTLPDRHQFPSAANYYQTALHELGHATGHQKRLGNGAPPGDDRTHRPTLRDGIKAGFGSPDYAREELRAEVAAMMTGDRLRTGHDPARGAAYVEGWVAALDEDPREIHRAAAEAQRMSNYIVGRARELLEKIDEDHEKARDPGHTPTRSPEPDRAPDDRAVEQPQPVREQVAAVADRPSR